MGKKTKYLSLEEAEIVKYTIKDDKTIPVSSEELEGFTHSVSVERSIDIQEQLTMFLFEYETKVHFVRGLAKGRKVGGKFKISLVFKIDNLKKYIKETNEKVIVVDDDLNLRLWDLSTNISKGMLIEKTKGTFLEKAFLSHIPLTPKIGT